MRFAGLIFLLLAGQAQAETPGAVAWEKARAQQNCAPMNGALEKLYGVWGIEELKFGCGNWFGIFSRATSSLCPSRSCQSFTGIKGPYHYFGYIGRDSFNTLEVSFCSHNGGWPGGFDGECPEGVLTDDKLEYTKGLAK